MEVNRLPIELLHFVFGHIGELIHAHLVGNFAILVFRIVVVNDSSVLKIQRDSNVFLFSVFILLLESILKKRNSITSWAMNKFNLL